VAEIRRPFSGRTAPLKGSDLLKVGLAGLPLRSLYRLASGCLVGPQEWATNGEWYKEPGLLRLCVSVYVLCVCGLQERMCTKAANLGGRPLHASSARHVHHHLPLFAHPAHVSPVQKKYNVSRRQMSERESLRVQMDSV
jgi:hypothetical protein